MRVYLDSCTLIDATEGADTRADLLQALFVSGRRNGGRFVTSERSMAEVMVKPLKDGNRLLMSAYLMLLSNDPGAQIEVEAVDRHILAQAAFERARSPGLKLPDAIHLATAGRAACTHLVTRDARLLPAARLPVVFGDEQGLRAFMDALPQ